MQSERHTSLSVTCVERVESFHQSLHTKPGEVRTAALALMREDLESPREVLQDISLHAEEKLVRNGCMEIGVEWEGKVQVLYRHLTPYQEVL